MYFVIIAFKTKRKNRNYKDIAEVKVHILHDNVIFLQYYHNKLMVSKLFVSVFFRSLYFDMFLTVW